MNYIEWNFTIRCPYIAPLIDNIHGTMFKQAVGSTGVLRVADGGQLLLACTGPRNYQTTSNEQSGIATCRSGLLTVKDDKDRPVAVNNQSTPCKKNAAASDQVTNDFCGSINNQGIIVEMGFQVRSHFLYTNTYVQDAAIISE